MSASEKLRGLELETGLEWSAGRRYPECLTVRYPRTEVDPHDYFHTRMVSSDSAVSAAALLNALPQIVALVEATEQAEDILRQHARGGDLIHGRHLLYAALAALDEELS